MYFVSTRRFTDLKWGTMNPIMLRDPEFGPVRLRTFGTYVVRVSDPATFIREIVGTDAHFTTEEITDQLRNMIVSRFADLLGESKIPVLDLAANYDELGQFVTERIKEGFAAYGLEITTLLVENISLPPAVEEALDKRSSMGIIGDLNRYTQYQTAEAMRDAAANPGGMAAGGMGMGMGFAMANQMGQMMNAPAAAPPSAPPAQASTPPPLPGATEQYFLGINGQSAGPFSLAVLTEKAQRGEFKRATLVWKQGMADWRIAEQVEALRPLFTTVPPPLPPDAVHPDEP